MSVSDADLIQQVREIEVRWHGSNAILAACSNAEDRLIDEALREALREIRLYADATRIE